MTKNYQKRRVFFCSTTAVRTVLASPPSDYNLSHLITKADTAYDKGDIFVIRNGLARLVS